MMKKQGKKLQRGTRKTSVKEDKMKNAVLMLDNLTTEMKSARTQKRRERAQKKI